MLPLGGQRAVGGDDGPAVFLRAVFDFFAPGVDHGLDGEGHAFAQHVQRAGAAVVQDLRLFVEDLADAVAAELAHHRVALAFGKTLDRKADVAQVNAGFHHPDAVPHGLIGDAAQAFGGNRAFAHHEHAAGVAVPGVFDDGDVDVHHVAFFQRLVIRNAVANLVVDRGANGLGIGDFSAAAVIERRWNTALHVDDVVVRQLVQRVGAHARHHKGRQVIQHFGGQPSSQAHACNPVGVFVGDGHGGDYPIGPVGFALAGGHNAGT